MKKQPATSLAPHVLADNALLAGVDSAKLQDVLARATLYTLASEEVLIEPGDDNHSLYLLTEGGLEVHLDAPGSGNSFPIEPGEIIGEMSVIEGRKTSAWVIAARASQIVELPEDVFWDFASLPGAISNMLKILTRRMRKSNEVIIGQLEQQIRYEYLERDLAAAGKIQSNMLRKPDPLFPKHPQIDVYASVLPAREVGGDFFEAYPLDADHVMIAVGDVSGKGMPAALFMVRCITLLREHLSEPGQFEAVALKMNRLLSDNNEDCMFVTLFLGILNVRTGVLRYTNAGHNAPFVALDGQSFGILNVPDGMLMGVWPEAKFGIAEAQMTPGDMLVVYSDGVTEANDPGKEQFGELRAIEVLDVMREVPSVREVVSGLQDTVKQFADTAPQFDDITVLALRYNGDVADAG